MAIVDDYTAIAAELRRIQAEQSRPEKSAGDRKTAALVTGRGVIHVDIGPGPWRNRVIRIS